MRAGEPAAAESDGGGHREHRGSGLREVGKSRRGGTDASAGAEPGRSRPDHCRGARAGGGEGAGRRAGRGPNPTGRASGGTRFRPSEGGEESEGRGRRLSGRRAEARSVGSRSRGSEALGVRRRAVGGRVRCGGHQEERDSGLWAAEESRRGGPGPMGQRALDRGAPGRITVAEGESAMAGGAWAAGPAGGRIRRGAHRVDCDFALRAAEGRVGAGGAVGSAGREPGCTRPDDGRRARVGSGEATDQGG